MITKTKTSSMMTMSQDDIRYRRRLLERWNFTCIICGQEFANLACVTKEHLIPKSLRDRVVVDNTDNIAPSHFRCNQVRGTNSLFVALAIVNLMRQRFNAAGFEEWLNIPVPHRIVPPEALQPIIMPRTHLRSFELPEWLPGIT